MKPYLRPAFMGLALAIALAAGAQTQDGDVRVLDRGKLITYQGGVPVATESFVYSRQGDSLLVSAESERRRRLSDGTEQRLSKTMVLYARAEDFGLLNYSSNETLDGQLVLRSIEPADTLLTVHTEVKGGHGETELLDRPPGRIFAMDQGLFTLFDVIGRNLQHRIFGSRPVQLVVFGNETHNVEATASLAGADTVIWGGKRVVTERITLRDSTSAFTLWLSPEGHMLRLESEDGRLVVMREPPALTPAKKPRPKTRVH